MTQRAEEVLATALQLSESERAQMAARLIDSLDSEIDDDADQMWVDEIRRRNAEIDSGQAITMTREEALNRIRSSQQNA